MSNLFFINLLYSDNTDFTDSIKDIEDQEQDPVWVEVREIPPNIAPYNKLILPGHKFLRKKPLEVSPSLWRKRTKGVKYE
jgi:hypothetical protein